MTLTNQQALHRNCAGCHDEIMKTSKDSIPNIEEMYGLSQESCSVTSNRKVRWRIMKVLKFMTVAAILAAFFAVVVMVSAASRTAGYDQFDAGTGSGSQFDGVATYKAKLCLVGRSAMD